MEPADSPRARRPRSIFRWFSLKPRPWKFCANLHGVHALISRLLYGTGMRVMECMRLRVKDVDFARGEILVRDGKGRKDRVTVLPRLVASPLRRQLNFARALHEKDVKAGCGEAWLPFALACRYRAAAHEWAWQYVFPAPERSRDPRRGAVRRHHLSDQSFQRAMRQALRDAAYAAPFVRDASAGVGYDIRTYRSCSAMRTSAQR